MYYKQGVLHTKPAKILGIKQQIYGKYKIRKIEEKISKFKL